MDEFANIKQKQTSAGEIQWNFLGEHGIRQGICATINAGFQGTHQRVAQQKWCSTWNNCYLQHQLSDWYDKCLF